MQQTPPPDTRLYTTIPDSSDVGPAAQQIHSEQFIQQRDVDKPLGSSTCPWKRSACCAQIFQLIHCRTQCTTHREPCPTERSPPKPVSTPHVQERVLYLSPRSAGNQSHAVPDPCDAAAIGCTLAADATAAATESSGIGDEGDVRANYFELCDAATVPPVSSRQLASAVDPQLLTSLPKF
eukprot:346614-Amphidinium_carterae.1